MNQAQPSSPIDRHLVVKVLEFGVQQGVFTLDQLNAHLKGANDGQRKYLRNTLTGIVHQDATGEHRTLTPEALFAYMEYVELQEARAASLAAQKESERAFQQSAKANRIAIGSLVVSAVLAFVSIVLQIVQSPEPMKSVEMVLTVAAVVGLAFAGYVFVRFLLREVF